MWTVTFALFVLRHPTDPKRYVLVDEGKRGWWLPGGGVDGNETFLEGGKREAVEEAGVEVDDHSIGLLKVELSYQRLRYILAGKAKSESLKTQPDKESQGAKWVSMSDTIKFHRQSFPGVPNPYLRGGEPLEWFGYLEEGGASFPLDGFAEVSVEPGATGKDYGGRSAFAATVVCSLALAVGSTGEFVIDPSCKGSEIRLPRFSPELEREETLNQCVQRGLEELGFIEPLGGVLALRDMRNMKNELDFRAAYLVPVKSTKMKTAKPEQFTDAFERKALERACAGKIFPLTLLGTE
jgi:8-oxo-dGTP pyrophosphatase MutT (NUDIX family)